MQQAREYNYRNSASKRGRSRGRGRFQAGRGNASGGVPSSSQVNPGGFVSIVLKIDQGTGREVQGVVQDVLTNGNHPRGIKVRLADGRVGRVQQMVSEGEAMAGQEGLSGLGENGETLDGGRRRESGRNGGISRGDRRGAEQTEQPRAGFSLEDFLPVGHSLRNDSSASATQDLDAIRPSEAEEGSLVCPLCEFKGDEAAVSHHVNIHFDEP